MEHLSNPAGRLYVALNTLREGGDERAIGEVIRTVYIDGDDDQSVPPRRRPWLSEAHEVLSLIAAMPQDVRVEVERQRLPVGMLNRLPLLEDAISQLALGARVVDWKQRVREDAMAQLESVSHMLDHLHIETVPDSAELADLLTAVSELLEDVIKTIDLDGPLRSFLLDRLFEMEEALRRYPFEGVIGIEKVAQATFGAVAVSAPTNPRSEGDKKAIDAFWRVFTRLTAVVTFLNQSIALEAAVSERLGLNPRPQPHEVIIVAADDASPTSK